MAKVQRMTRKRLGEILIDEGILTPEQMQEALEYQQSKGGLLGEILVDLGLVTERDIAKTIAKQLSLPFLSAKSYNVDEDIKALLPLEVMKRYCLIPLDRFGAVINVLVGGPINPAMIEEIERVTGCTAQFFVGLADEIKDYITMVEEGGGLPEREEGAAPAPAAAAEPKKKAAAHGPADLEAEIQALAGVLPKGEDEEEKAPAAKMPVATGVVPAPDDEDEEEPEEESQITEDDLLAIFDQCDAEIQDEMKKTSITQIGSGEEDDD